MVSDIPQMANLAELKSVVGLMRMALRNKRVVSDSLWAAEEAEERGDEVDPSAFPADGEKPIMDELGKCFMACDGDPAIKIHNINESSNELSNLCQGFAMGFHYLSKSLCCYGSLFDDTHLSDLVGTVQEHATKTF